MLYAPPRGSYKRCKRYKQWMIQDLREGLLNKPWYRPATTTTTVNVLSTTLSYKMAAHTFFDSGESSGSGISLG